MADVVCIGAHPDDVEIGMGAAVYQMAIEGLRVVIVDLTDGEPTPFGTRERRLAEAAKAAAVLRAERFTLELPNRSLADTPDARKALATVLRELRPRIVVGPYPLDAHPDHVAAASVVLGGRFYAKLTKSDIPGVPHFPERVYRYAAIHDAAALVPSFVIPATEEALAAKMDALRAYRSQFADNPGNAGLLERVELQTRYWGSLVRSPAGEPFFATEIVGVRSLDSLV